MEKELISYMLKIATPEELREILSSSLTHEDFGEHGEIYKWLCTHIQEFKKAPTPSVFEPNFPPNAFLPLLKNEITSSWEQLTDGILVQSSLRDSNEFLSEIDQELHSKVPDLKKIELSSRGLANRMIERHRTYDHVDAEKDYDAFLAACQTEQEEGPAVTTPFPILNTHLGGGFRKASFVLLSAFMYMGKSWLMLRFALHAWKTGLKVFIWSSEMTVFEIEKRLHALRTGVSYSRWIRGTATDREIELMKQKPNFEGTLHIYGADCGAVTHLADLTTLVDKHDSDFVICDGLNHIRPTEKALSKVDQAYCLAPEVKRYVSTTKKVFLGVIQQNEGDTTKKNAILNGSGMESALHGKAWGQNTDYFFELHGDREQGTKQVSGRKLRDSVPMAFFISIDTKEFTRIEQVGTTTVAEQQEASAENVAQTQDPKKFTDKQTVDNIFPNSAVPEWDDEDEEAEYADEEWVDEEGVTNNG